MTSRTTNGSTSSNSVTDAELAVIVHGAYATPSDHWFSWLAGKLQEKGISSVVPALPNTDAPDAIPWQRTVAEAVGTPDERTLVVAHSLGCLTVLRHLASLDGSWRLGGLVLVAGFVDKLPPLPDLDEFIEGGVEVADLPQHIDRIGVIRSDRDEYVPVELTDRLAELLGAPVRVVDGAGHFLGDEGVMELPEVLEALFDN